MLASTVGHALNGCSWVGVPFAGGMSELPHITARTLVVNDLHRHVINLAMVAADPIMNGKLVERLEGLPFHPDVLTKAQDHCQLRESLPIEELGEAESLDWAVGYFVSAWMSRNGQAGTEKEFSAGLSLRWEAGGGDSNTRFRNAAQSLRDWQNVLQRCTFSALDCFEFLSKCKDRAGHGLYIDAPWPNDGDDYKFSFSKEQQSRLATVLAGYKETRVVVRYGDHPLIRELYPTRLWKWTEQPGRTGANKIKAEVLLTNIRGKE